MNNLKEYLIRKSKELTLLGKKAKLRHLQLSVNDLIRAKDIYAYTTKQNEKLKELLLPTNVFGRSLKNSNLEYQFNYSRYDSSLKIKNFLKKQYDLDGIEYRTCFTNCGMSAISVLLLVLNECFRTQITHQKDIYFETYLMIKKFKLNHFFHSLRVLWLDFISYNPNFHKFLSKNNADVVVIDTTCLVDKAILKKLVEKVKNQKKLFILVQSHTKLDMLGTEYSKLGSITFLLPPKIDKKYLNLISTYNFFLGKFGVKASIKDIPPFWFNTDFNRINNERLYYLQKNTQYVYKQLIRHYNDFIIPKHNLFLLKPANGQSIETIKERLKHNKYISFSGSFGFDFICIDTYFDVAQKRQLIRIALSDYPKEIIDTVIKDITNAFQH